MEDAGEEMVVVYTPHLTEAYPSRTDVPLATEPQAHYVLVSTAETAGGDGPISIRSFRILDGQVREEDIEVTDSYLTDGVAA